MERECDEGVGVGDVVEEGSSVPGVVIETGASDVMMVVQGVVGSENGKRPGVVVVVAVVGKYVEEEDEDRGNDTLVVSGKASFFFFCLNTI